MVLTTDVAATAFGLLAAGMLVICPLITSPQRLLQVQTAMGLAFATHFLLLGVVPAAAMNALAAVQSVAALATVRRPTLAPVGYGIIPVMWLAGAVFWSGPLTLLAVAAMTVVALARMMTREMPMRVAFLLGSGLWFAHDALVGAWIPLCADIFCAAIGLGMIFRRLSIGPTWITQATPNGLRVHQPVSKGWRAAV